MKQSMLDMTSPNDLLAEGVKRGWPSDMGIQGRICAVCQELQLVANEIPQLVTRVVGSTRRAGRWDDLLRCGF